MHKVDVIIPLYNKAETVGRTIESVLSQTMGDFHLIIVDDGSTDGSVEAARRFADSRITIVSQENQGPGAARNKGIELARARYVAFLDADDQWYPFYLDNAMKAIDQSELGFVGTTYFEWPDQVDMTGYWARRNVRPGVYCLNGDEAPVDVLSFLFFFHVGNTVVRTSVARKYQGFYAEGKCLLGEDTVFFAKLVFNESFGIITPAAVRHNRQDSELSNLEDRPIDIFLRKPEIILDYCDERSAEQARRVLDIGGGTGRSLCTLRAGLSFFAHAA